MKSRHIMFSAPMVRAILEGRKTQTRRVAIKTSQPHVVYATDFDQDECLLEIENSLIGKRYWNGCPYGKPGDQLWVRETCRAEELPSGLDGVRYAADGAFREIENTHEASDVWVKLNGYRGGKGLTVPTIHMPRWASRITLEITGVRVERLNEISGADCIAEGIIESDAPQYAFGLHDAYRDLWESINGPGSWDANPWVWVIEFAVVKP
jgi:hypothetical protein